MERLQAKSLALIVLLISDLTNSRKGTIGFVVGAGPSLNFEDRDLLKGHTTIAVNSAIRAIPDADFFLTGDPACVFWDYWNKEVVNSPSIKLFQADRMEPVSYSIPGSQKCFYTCQAPHHPHYIKDKSKTGLDMSCKEYIIGSRTSAGAAVHFAHIMGCDPIVLLGCDARYLQGKRYFWQFPSWEKVSSKRPGTKVFSRPNAGHIEGVPVDQHCRDFLDYWIAVADANKNVLILNASVDSLVDAFPKVALPEVIKEYGTQRDRR